MYKNENHECSVINLLDQNLNNLYEYSTKETIQYGHKKFLLDENTSQDEHILAISCQLKRHIYMSPSESEGKVHAVFDNSEVYWLTTKVIKKLLSMQPASFINSMKV